VGFLFRYLLQVEVPAKKPADNPDECEWDRQNGANASKKHWDIGDEPNAN